MSILHIPRRDEETPERYLFLEDTISLNFFYDFDEEDFGQSAKKIDTFRTAFNMSGGQNVWKNFFFGLVTILVICSDCDGNTFESSAKNSLVGSPNCMYVSKWKVRTKWLSFEPFKFKFFPDFELKVSSSVVKT